MQLCRSFMVNLVKPWENSLATRQAMMPGTSSKL